MANINKNIKCPCGSGENLNFCCGQFIYGYKKAETAELLMRSRYTAYFLLEKDYLLKTWHISTRPIKFNLDLNIKWIGLQIIDSIAGGTNDNSGSAFFEASYYFQSTLYNKRKFQICKRKGHLVLSYG